ncbi:MAG: precorrin-6A reductase [Candidatus Methanoplasma sp.]|jgi:precorrin-6Y C5,15-methyltransferase (decarboxylating)|nr:precorrin-6A reductase [Candidatus Methanoplasma sp.]
MSVVLFGGTTEGRMLADLLRTWDVPAVVCVATEFGGGLVAGGGSVKVYSERLGDEGRRRLIEGCTLVVDATHPYSVNMTCKVIEECRRLGREYVRIERPAGMSELDEVIEAADAKAAAEYLDGTEGNILVTIGSHELSAFAAIDGYRDRVYARVLSSPSVAQSCAEMGFEGKNVFLMQGPFCEELNYGMIKQTNAKYLVTKDSGDLGGFGEKLRAAKRAGARVVVIGRPDKPPGMGFDEVARLVAERFGKHYSPACEHKRRTVRIVGIGVGPGTLTADGRSAVDRADVLIGGPRMISTVGGGKAEFHEYRADPILEYLDGHPEHRDAVVLVSGDAGFFSMAKELLSKINGDRYDVETVCGVSSVAYLCAKTGETWDDALLMSSHAKAANVVGAVSSYRKTIALLDGAGGAERLCSDLSEYGLDSVRVTMGMDLGGDDERIVSGRPSEFVGTDFGRLCIAMIVNDSPTTARSCIPDDLFIRGDAPMTKSEVRSLSVSKLCLDMDSVVYDIGAGTGSVSVEAALAAPAGTVYAVEKERSSADLVEKNAKKFSVPNVRVVVGTAPDAFEGLPAPTHVFIGGSSGNLREIVRAVLEKAPNVRIVVNSVTLETVSETIGCIRETGLVEEETLSVSVARSKSTGGYHLMTAQNPVFITVCRGRG